MAEARCSCGAIALEVPAQSQLVVACHCISCQRRTGAPFSVGAFYAADAVTISGTAKEYCRDAASGAKVRQHFCPTCGSTVYWTADRLPGMIGVAVGALADPSYHPPDRSLFEQSKHHWVEIEAATAHFAQGSAPPR